jgi:hypothetical protein
LSGKQMPTGNHIREVFDLKKLQAIAVPVAKSRKDTAYAPAVSTAYAPAISTAYAPAA